MTLKEIARALGGEVVSGGVMAPGPGHGPRDRSLSVKLSPSSPGGFIVHSFANDTWEECRAHVPDRLRIDASPRRSESRPLTVIHRDASSDDQRRRLAVKCWQESRDPRETIVEAYLRGRGLKLPDEVCGVVIRFHPACPWREVEKTIQVPAMISAMRSIDGDQLVAVHRSRLTPEGQKVDRRMLGIAAGAAIKLDADDAVLSGLHIGEGVETCLAARQLGLRPTWALGSAGAIAAFPILSGLEVLTLLAEHDDASARAVEACAARWFKAGREVLINRPFAGKDLADAVRRIA